MEDVTLAPTKNLTTPDFGGATDVTIIDILVKPGDSIEKDMPIMTLESDKATMELPASEGGVVKELKVKVGDKVSTGSLLLTIETKDDQKPQPKSEPEAKTETSTNTKESVSTTSKPVVAPIDTKSVQKNKSQEQVSDQTADLDEAQENEDVHAGPGVRRLAHELGVDLNQIQGSGPKDRILKEDVNQFVKSKLSQVGTNQSAVGFDLPKIDFSKFGETATEALSRIKKLSGKNLQRNWMMIPHVTQFAEADITELEAFRAEQKVAMEKESVKLTPLVFIMKAVVAALREFPQFNASLEANGEALVLKKYFHIGVAVDTPDGLVVPVVRDVDQKGLVTLAKELSQLSDKARKKQLTPNEMQGGSFSISSLGGIGGTAFTPIINYPEVAILGVSKSTYRPFYQDGQFVPRLMLPLSLSYDHRVIDGAQGARFIMYLSQMLSDIRNLLM